MITRVSCIYAKYCDSYWTSFTCFLNLKMLWKQNKSNIIKTLLTWVFKNK